MLEAITLSTAIDRPWREVYEAVWQPEGFPRWASGLSRSSLKQDGDRWIAEGPEGSVRIRFTEHNPFGVMDHRVELENGSVVDIPLRVIANGDDAEVLLTLFRHPDMTDEIFQRDQDWVRRDLTALKALVEGER